MSDRFPGVRLKVRRRLHLTLVPLFVAMHQRIPWDGHHLEEVYIVYHEAVTARDSERGE